MHKYIAYLSKQSFHMTDDELTNLLKSSRKYNDQNEITGLLVHIAGNFVQYMEGPVEHVDRVYSKIQKDPRHTDILLISEGVYLKRFFHSWGMAFKKMNDDYCNTLSGYWPFDINLLFNYQLNEDTEAFPVLGLLQNFVREIKD